MSIMRGVLATLLALVLFPAAAFASSCGGQTYTYFYENGQYRQTSNNAVMDQNWLVNVQNNGLGANNTLRIKNGTPTLSMNSFVNSNRICVDSGATLSIGNMNQAAGHFLNYGTLRFNQSVSFSGGSIDNYATLEAMAGFNTNVNSGTFTLQNRANANALFRSSFQLGNNTVGFNDGRLVAYQNIQTTTGNTFTNNFEMITRLEFNPGGTFYNYGRVHAEAFININSPSYTYNYCSLISDKGFNNSSIVDNYGMVFINRPGIPQPDKWQNNGNATFRMGSKAFVYGWTFYNNGRIENISGQTGGEFYFNDATGTNIVNQTNQQGTFTGASSAAPIKFWDTTRNNNNPFDFQQPAPVNTVRQEVVPKGMDWAAPTCSPMIRQVMYDPEPPTVTYDYGDAPASYGVPYHEIRASTAGIYLGSVKPDWDGSPAGTNPPTPAFGGYATANADGDDLSLGGDDEDGITTMPTISRGVLTTLNIKVNGAGYLNAWIDYNLNGVFDTAEKIANNVQDNGAGGTGNGRDWDASGNGNIQLRFTPPSGTNGKSFIRLRWSAQQNLGPTGVSTSGEVEDYVFTFGLAPEPPLPPGGGPGAGGGTTPSSCSGSQTVTIYSNNAQSVVAAQTSNTSDSAMALGAISLSGSYASASNSALLGTGGVLVLDLTGMGGNLLPAYADIVLSIGRGDASSRVLVEVSANGTSWTSVGTWGSGGTKGNDFSNGVLTRVMFEHSSSVRYVRFTRQAGTFWVDGVSTADICGPIGSATLTVVKSSEAATSGDFMLPGKDVIYNILVSNTGTMPADANSVVLIDELPPHITFRNLDFGAAGTNAVTFSQVGNGLTFNYATNVRLSNATTRPTSFANCNYTPGSPATGYNSAVKYVCVQPGGTLNAASQFTIRFKARIK